MRKVVLGLAVVLALVAAGYVFREDLARYASQVMPATSGHATRVPPPSFSAVVKRVAPAVVTIVTQGKKPGTTAIGSGFIIDPEGFIVTNDHVIDGGGKIEVTFEDGHKLPATLVGTDKPTDISLLKVESKTPLPFVNFGDDHKSEVGDWVIALGSPDYLPGTVTAGILSARGRDGVDGGSMFTDYLQIDAAINHGNSGGPTFNMDGEVIGVNTLASYNSIDPKTGVGERNEGLGFAIPSSTVSVVVKGLRTGHFNRGLLGVFLEKLSEADALALGLTDTHGALVTRVMDGSPAEKAGVKVNDVIRKIDGEEVTSDRDCLRKISLLQPEQSAAFTIWRDKAEMVVTIVVASRDKTLQSSLEPAPATPATVSYDALGVTLRSAPLGGIAGLGSEAMGVYVDEAAGGLDLASLGLRRGDRITAVGGRPVTSLEDIAREIDAARQQKLGAVLFYIETPLGGQTHTSVKLK